MKEKLKSILFFKGIYRGASHNLCNLKLNNVREIPVFFHNLKYDSHLFITELAAYPSKFNLEIIPSTTENYIGICKKVPLNRHQNYTSKHDPYLKIMFKDSFKFLSKSLDALCKSLDKSKDFKILDQEFGAKSNLLKQKGVFPYSLIKSLSDYNLSFPSRDTFPNVTDAEYAYAHLVANEFNCRNLGEYSDLYQKTDCCILADIFEKFRDDSLAAYGLDPAKFLSSPSLSFQAMLKYTGAKIELISDPSMHSLIRRGIRGGLTQAVCRKSEAKNHYLDPEITENENYLVYLDMVKFHFFV